VFAGIVLSLGYFLYQRLHPRIIEVAPHPDGSLRDRHLWQLPAIAPEVLALRMDAELDFASAQSLERHITDQLAQRPDIRILYLAALPINRIDVTGVEMFVRLRRSLQKQGIALHIGGMKLPVEQILVRAGALVPGDDLVLYRTDAQALSSLALQLRRQNRRCRQGMREADTLPSHFRTIFVTGSKAFPMVSLQDLQLEAARALVGAGQLPADAEPARYLQALIDGLCELSLKDPLTGLSNRRQLFTVIDANSTAWPVRAKPPCC
jgi:anti-anti-sigma regulatory factor